MPDPILDLILRRRNAKSLSNAISLPTASPIVADPSLGDAYQAEVGDIDTKIRDLGFDPDDLDVKIGDLPGNTPRHVVDELLSISDPVDFKRKKSAIQWQAPVVGAIKRIQDPIARDAAMKEFDGIMSVYSGKDNATYQDNINNIKQAIGLITKYNDGYEGQDYKDLIKNLRADVEYGSAKSLLRDKSAQTRWQSLGLNPVQGLALDLKSIFDGGQYENQIKSNPTDPAAIAERRIKLAELENEGIDIIGKQIDYTLSKKEEGAKQKNEIFNQNKERLDQLASIIKQDKTMSESAKQSLAGLQDEYADALEGKEGDSFVSPYSFDTLKSKVEDGSATPLELREYEKRIQKLNGITQKYSQNLRTFLAESGQTNDNIKEYNDIISSMYQGPDKDVDNLAGWAQYLSGLKDTQRERFPEYAQIQTERLVKDIVGNQFGQGMRFVGRIASGLGDNVQAVKDVVQEITLNPEKLREQQMSDAYKRRLLDLSINYDTPEQRMEDDRVVIPVLPKYVQDRIDQLKASGLSQDEIFSRASQLIDQESKKGRIKYAFNPRYGKLNLTGESVLSAISSVTSQLIPQMITSLGTGGFGNISKAKRLANLFAVTAAQTFSREYDRAVQAGESHPFQRALQSSFINGFTELPFDNINLVKQFGKAVKSIGGDLTEAQIGAMVKRKLPSAIGSAALAGGEVMAKEGALEEGSAQLLQNISDKFIFNDDKKITEDLGNTILVSSIGMLPLGVFGAAGKFRSARMGDMLMMYQAGVKADQVIKSINDKLSSGELTAKEAQERIDAVRTMNTVIDNMSMYDKSGKPLTDEQKARFAFNEFVKSKANATTNIPAPQQQELREIADEADKQNAAILNGEEVVPTESADKKETIKQKFDFVTDSDFVEEAFTPEEDAADRAALPESDFQSEQELEDFLANGEYAMLTGMNPDAVALSKTANKELNNRASQWLESRGLKATPIFGKYGNSERSFLVPNMTKAQAIEFAKEFQQDSVAHSSGLVYKDGSFNPRTEGVNLEPRFDQGGDFFSSINVGGKPVDFSINYDFDTTVPADGMNVNEQGQLIDTKLQDAVSRAAKSLEKFGIKFKIIDSSVNPEQADAARGDQGIFRDTDGTVIIDRSKLADDIDAGAVVWHESSHPVINIIRNTNPELYAAVVRGLKEAAKQNKDVDETKAWAEKEYTGDDVQDDEAVVETIARIAEGVIDLSDLKTGLRQMIIDLINNIAKYFGIPPIVRGSDIGEFKRVTTQVAKALTQGKDVSKIVGKKNVKKFENILGTEQKRISASDVLSRDERGDKKVVEVAQTFEDAVDEVLDPQSDPNKRITRFLRNAYEDLRYFLSDYSGDTGLDWYTNKVKEFNAKLEDASDIAIKNGEMPAENSLRDKDNMDLFKVVLALSSIGVNPRENVKAAFAIWKTFNQETKTFSKYQPGLVSIRTNIPDSKGGFEAPSGEIVKEGEKFLDIKQKNGKVIRLKKSDLAKEFEVTYLNDKGKQVTKNLRFVKETGKAFVFRSGPTEVKIPKENVLDQSEIGDGIQGKGWTTKGNVVAINLNRLEGVLADHSSLKSALEWINSKHPVAELRKYNSGVPDVEGKKGKINPKGERLGSYIIGEKLGAFHQNVAGTPSELTMDLWWSRTWNRYMGTLISKDKDGESVIQETPRTDNERNVMREAAKLAADALGLEVHEFQATLWYLEQQMYKRMGAAVESYSFVDGIDQVLLQYGKSNEELQPERYGIDSSEADKRRTDAAARAADIIYGESGREGQDGSVRKERVQSSVGNRGRLQASVGNRGKLAPKVVRTAIDSVKDIVTKMGYGYLPENVQDRMKKKQMLINEDLHDMEVMSGQLKEAIKKEYGKTYEKLDDDTKGLIDDALRNFSGATNLEALRAQLPDQVLSIIDRMRFYVDSMSLKLNQIGVLDDSLEPAFDGDRGLGVYLTRSYRKYDDPTWSQNIPDEVKQRAFNYLKSQTITEDGVERQMTDEEVEGLMDFLATNTDPVMEGLNASNTGRVKADILKGRKVIPEEIRALMGEYKDPIVNFAKSIAKMSSLYHTHQTLKAIADENIGKIFFKRPTGEYFAPVAGEKTSNVQPLAGLYTTPEIAEAFRQAATQSTSNDLNNLLLRGLASLSAVVKIGKTAGSVSSWVRNIIGGYALMLKDGHLLGTGMADGWSTAMRYFANKNVNDPAVQEKFKEYIRMGIIGDGVQVGEFFAIIKAAQKHKGPMEWLENDSKLGKFVKGVKGFYSIQDDVFRIWAYENEKARLASRKSMNEEELKSEAARKARATYPTYSEVPEIVRQLARFVPISSFPAFSAELIRTTKNSFKIAFEEIKDPQMRDVGVKRLAGVLSYLTWSSALAGVSAMLTGVGDDERDAIRRYLPEWSKNSQLVFLGRDKNNLPIYVDLGFSDPASYFKKPFVALQNEDKEFDGRVKEALGEAFDPFTSPDILFSQLYKAQKKVRKSDDVEDVIGKYAGPLYEAVEPGTIASLRRIYKGLSSDIDSYGQKYDAKLETIAFASGQRIKTMDVPVGFDFKVRDFMDMKKDITGSYYSEKYKTGGDKQKIQEELDVANEKLAKEFEEFRKDYRAGLLLMSNNMPTDRAKKAMRAIMQERNVPKDFITALETGKRMPELKESKKK